MSKPTPMSFDEAVRVLRGADLSALEPGEVLAAGFYMQIQFYRADRMPGDPYELALAIETISQSAEEVECLPGCQTSRWTEHDDKCPVAESIGNNATELAGENS